MLSDMQELYSLFLELNDNFCRLHGENTCCLSTDSRNCLAGTLFFALKGDKFNGNAFALSALNNGAVKAVVDEAVYAIDDRFILVPDVLRALQGLAREHRIALGTPVIGITGTNGKTTTKELIVNVLQKNFRVHYTQGNLNNHIGVPLTLLRMNETADIAVIEMGASHPGDIKELVEIACPNAGLVTNVGKAHLQGFGTFEGVMRTKGELYDYIRQTGGFIFRNLDNEYLSAMAGDLPVHGYSQTTDKGEVNGHAINCKGLLKMEISFDGERKIVDTQLVGGYNVENVLAAACVGFTFGLTAEQICFGIEGYVPKNNRSMLLQTEYNTVVVDAYNANPTSMKAAIENIIQTGIVHPLLILGDMLELGDNSMQEHQAILNLLCEYDLTDVYLVGKEFGQLHSEFPCFADVVALEAYLRQNSPRERYILLKGSRGIGLEQLLPWL